MKCRKNKNYSFLCLWREITVHKHHRHCKVSQLCNKTFVSFFTILELMSIKNKAKPTEKSGREKKHTELKPKVYLTCDVYSRWQPQFNLCSPSSLELPSIRQKRPSCGRTDCAETGLVTTKQTTQDSCRDKNGERECEQRLRHEYQAIDEIQFRQCVCMIENVTIHERHACLCLE